MFTLPFRSLFVGVVSILVTLPLHAQQPTACQPGWLPAFGGAPGVDAQVACMAVFDDGSGPAMYVGGQFRAAGGIDANYVAKWDGAHWSALGSGTSGMGVGALAVYDDGSGPALYAAGHILTAGGVSSRGIARWNGSSWSPLGTGLNGPAGTLAVFDDGSGPALYVGGMFTVAGGTQVDRIARWNGSNWSAVGGGVSGGSYCVVNELTVFDDGSGPALFATGYFTSAGGISASNIAKWSGTNWSALGTGLSSIGNSLTTYDDGTGPALYACGNFEQAGGVNVGRVAKWDGTTWSALPGGGFNSYVNGLTAFDDGSGPALYACGMFGGGSVPSHIAKWNGTSWSGLGSGLNNPLSTTSADAHTMFVYDDGTGPALYAGGMFTGAGVVTAHNVARWDGSNWSALGGAIADMVCAVAIYDDGGGPALFVGGRCLTPGGIATTGIAKWDGSAWSALGLGLAGPWYAPLIVNVDALAVFDDGSGPALYVGGQFSTAGGVPANGIAKWDGVQWTSLPGLGAGGITSLAVFDEGSGPALYAAGTFTIAGGVPTPGLAKWDGSSWSTVGGGVTGGSARLVKTLDDGTGPALYVSGFFTSAGGAPAAGMARWNGSNWTALGTQVARDLAVFDDGSGPALYAAGGVLTTDGVMKWNGTNWTLIGGAMTDVFPNDPTMYSLQVFDDGSGPALYAGGIFASAGGVAARNIAKWDGTGWSNLGSGLPVQVRTLVALDDGNGPSLFVGGAFFASPAGDSFLAKWGIPSGCGAPGVSICEPGTSGVMACPCGNPPAGAGRGCDNSSNTGGAALTATGIARLSYDTVVFTTSGERPTATSVLVQGDNQVGAGAVFGQGVRCVSGSLKRMYVKAATSGSIQAPESADLRVHMRSAALGDSIAPGTHRYYGVVYRDPIVLGGCPATSGFNVTQQLDVSWAP